MRCEPCTIGQVDSDNVFYTGVYLPTLDINTQTGLTTIIQTIDAYLQNFSGAQTLEEVTEDSGSNQTQSALQVTGDENLNTSLDSIALKVDGLLMGLYRYTGGILSGQLELGNATSNLTGGTSTLTVRTQTGGNSSILASGRVSASNASNDQDLIPKLQAENLIWGSMVTTTNTIFTSPLGTTVIYQGSADATVVMPTWNTGLSKMVRIVNDTATFDVNISSTGLVFIIADGTKTQAYVLPPYETVTFLWNGTDYFKI